MIQFPKASNLQDLLLSTWKMNEMLRMLFEDLITQSLEGRGAGSVLNGPRYCPVHEL